MFPPSIEDRPGLDRERLPGDVIIRLGGREVSDGPALSRMVAETPVDTVVTVQLWRYARKLVTA